MNATRKGETTSAPQNPRYGNQRVGEIAADRQKSAMGEVDDPRQVQDQRQTERHQRVERADDQPVEDVEEQQLRHAAIER